MFLNGASKESIKMKKNSSSGKKFLAYFILLASPFISFFLAMIWLFMLTMSTDGGDESILNIGLTGLLFPAFTLSVLSLIASFMAIRKQLFRHSVFLSMLPALLFVAALPALAVPLLIPVVSISFHYLWYKNFQKLRSK